MSRGRGPVLAPRSSPRSSSASRSSWSSPSGRRGRCCPSRRAAARRSTPPAGLPAGAGRTARESFAAALRPASLSRSPSAWPSPPCSGSPRSAAGWSGPSPRPLGGGWVWQVAARRPGARRSSAGWSRCRSRPTARWSGTATGCPPAAGGCGCATSPVVHGDRRRADRARRCSRSSGWPAGRRAPGGPGAPLGAAALVVVGSFLWPVVIEPAFNRFEPMPAGPLRTDLLALAERERHAGAGRARRRRVPADDGAERLRVRLRLDPAHRRLRHGARAAARRRRSSRSSPTSSATWPPTTSSPARSSARSGRPRAWRRSAGCCRWPCCSAGPERTRPAIRGSSPLVLFLMAVGTLLSTPLQNLVSRQIEARADVHALDLTARPRRVHRDAARAGRDQPLRPRPAGGLAVVLRLAPDDRRSGSRWRRDWERLDRP